MGKDSRGVAVLEFCLLSFLKTRYGDAGSRREVGALCTSQDGIVAANQVIRTDGSFFLLRSDECGVCVCVPFWRPTTGTQYVLTT